VERISKKLDQILSIYVIVVVIVVVAVTFNRHVLLREVALR
jgi:hypothetical protein